MVRFKYRLSLVYLTPDNVIATRRNSWVNLYLRIRRKGGLFPADYGPYRLQKKRVGHGSYFVDFLAEIALKHGFKHIGIQSINHKSRNFSEKLGFRSIDSYNYAATYS